MLTLLDVAHTEVRPCFADLVEMRMEMPRASVKSAVRNLPWRPRSNQPRLPLSLLLPLLRLLPWFRTRPQARLP